MEVEYITLKIHKHFIEILQVHVYDVGGEGWG